MKKKYLPRQHLTVRRLRFYVPDFFFKCIYSKMVLYPDWKTQSEGTSKSEVVTSGKPKEPFQHEYCLKDRMSNLQLDRAFDSGLELSNHKPKGA